MNRHVPFYQIQHNCIQDIKPFWKLEQEPRSLIQNIDHVIENQSTNPAVGDCAHLGHVVHSFAGAEVAGEIVVLHHTDYAGAGRNFGGRHMVHCGHTVLGEAGVAGQHKLVLHSQLAVHSLLRYSYFDVGWVGHHTDYGPHIAVVDLVEESRSSDRPVGSFDAVRRSRPADAAGTVHTPLVDVGSGHHIGWEVAKSSCCGSELQRANRPAGTTWAERYRYMCCLGSYCGCSRSRYQKACCASCRPTLRRGDRLDHLPGSNLHGQTKKKPRVLIDCYGSAFLHQAASLPTVRRDCLNRHHDRYCYHETACHPRAMILLVVRPDFHFHLRGYSVCSRQ